MLGSEVDAAETSPKPTPPIVESANADLSPDKCPESIRVAPPSFTGQSVLRAGQSSFNARTPFLNGPVGTPFDNDGLAEPGQRFGIALVPEGILQSQRQNDRLLQAACEMRHSGLNARRPFARIGEATLSRDPERGPRSSKDGAARAKELSSPSPCFPFDSKDPHAIEDPIAP